MEYDLEVLKALGLDGEPLDESRWRDFEKIRLVAEELVPGQYLDFGTVKIRYEGNGVVSFAKSWHAFNEAVKLADGESFLIYCTCPMSSAASLNVALLSTTMGLFANSATGLPRSTPLATAFTMSVSDNTPTSFPSSTTGRKPMLYLAMTKGQKYIERSD